MGKDETRGQKKAERRQTAERLLKNESFPKRFEGEEETPEVEETLEFWRSINNKEVSEGWKEDRSIRGVLGEVKRMVRRGRRCRWFAFTEAEFDEVLGCTAPWKACGVDSIYSFPIKKCPPIKKTVFQLVKKIVKWKMTDSWDEENN